jgi:DNA-binding CsgD family transcriptional regulator
MVAGIEPGKIVVHVLPTDPQVHALVERYLQDGGFVLPGGVHPPGNERVILAASRVELTARQREVLQVLASCDRTEQMADKMGVTEKAVNDLIQRLEEMMDVRSRHRLVLKAAALRLITVEPDP